MMLDPDKFLGYWLYFVMVLVVCMVACMFGFTGWVIVKLLQFWGIV